MRNFLFACLILGCGGSTGDGGGASVTQGDIDNFCTQTCAAQKKCDSKVDETTCVSNCKNQWSSYAGKVRTDYVTLRNDCVTTASCDKLKDCDDTAKASIAPSAAAQIWCDDALKKNAECKFNQDKAQCLDSMKIFSDAALESARACFSKPCGDYLGCVVSAIGVKF